MQRWWQYQKERFPLFAHGPLIFVFSLSAVSYSALLRGTSNLPSLAVGLTAFISCLLFFLQLRIADEFKDYQDDLTYRPYRPVPRGLISLRELGYLVPLTMLLQAGLALWLTPQLFWFLLLVWLYWALMWREFFVPDWLKARPLLYLGSHMLIMPLIDLYASATDWLTAGAIHPKAALGWFLVLSFFNGIVVEVGRKLRAPADEETGVETYTALYGTRNASLLWFLALIVTSLAALMAAYNIDGLATVAIVLGLMLGLALILLIRFQRKKTGSGKALELFSGIWTILLYLSLGILPLVWSIWQT